MGPPTSLQVPRARRYSGYSPAPSGFAYEAFTLSDPAFQPALLPSVAFCLSVTPQVFLSAVWPPPVSLATTPGISFDFFSSAYLDVSVRQVPLRILFGSDTDPQLFAEGVSPFGYLRIDAYFQLPAAFRRLSRPSSALSAKAFTLRSCSLERSRGSLLFKKTARLA